LAHTNMQTSDMG